MRVLIFTASTGGGHKKASAALEGYLKSRDSEAVVKTVDALKAVSKAFDKLISGGYVFLAKHAPRVYGKMYRRSDKDTKLNSLVDNVTGSVSKKIFPIIDEFKPDAIVTTHPFAAEMVSAIKEKFKLTVPLISIVTDFAPHKTYIQPNVDFLVVSSDEMKYQLENLGVKGSKIRTLGIPVDPVFYIKQDKNALLNEMELEQDVPTILMMAGSFGVSDVFDIYEGILNIPEKFQLIIITGNNKKLYAEFEQRLEKQGDGGKRTRLHFFVNDVYRYMHASDLLITKPGGLTVTEALASCLPMAIFKAYPGQEADNEDYLIRNNMAIQLPKGKKCAPVIQRLITDSEKLDSMKHSCEEFFKGKAVETISDLILEACGNNCGEN
ncbi:MULTISPECIES: glycosyltransferase [unclassified Ruminococcus]|uniref:MGDG synthase family glycosyltransferase n=1 Tax=unclassified Ruminococcus TaxID=2608920 RepID=UPI00210ED33B|nr:MULTISPECIES: glycosyltransferase [unclassified Ruminococcus]MCQ4022207.1 galactosyldiacylglycerol synthase [Ruminococcus sp. zg-924]MCQ4115230.1 galactosyldiacylglycerol synthase [Ruminococcus sp. zg-921]